MIPTSISTGTPVDSLTCLRVASLSAQNCAPARMRSGVMNISRYSAQLLVFSAGLAMASRIDCLTSAAPSVSRSCSRSNSCCSTMLSMNACTSGRSSSIAGTVAANRTQRATPASNRRIIIAAVISGANGLTSEYRNRPSASPSRYRRMKRAAAGYPRQERGL